MKMPKIIVAAVLCVCLSCNAQIKKDILKNLPIPGNTMGLSNGDIIRGLKEALSIGSRNSAGRASATDGYFGNPLIKIPFPKEAVQMETTLRNLGMNRQVDDFIKSLNRAAEDAAARAAPVFLNAISSMTITDGLSILKGTDDAATQYLKRTTSTQLKNEFKPVIKTSLNKVEVTKYWSPLINAYNKVPFPAKLNPDLDDYVTEKSLEGLFYLVAQEELKIRKDPSARVTDILKKVFGNKP